jgi:hypothetical protein
LAAALSLPPQTRTDTPDGAHLHYTLRLIRLSHRISPPPKISQCVQDSAIARANAPALANQQYNYLAPEFISRAAALEKSVNSSG